MSQTKPSFAFILSIFMLILSSIFYTQILQPNDNFVLHISSKNPYAATISVTMDLVRVPILFLLMLIGIFCHQMFTKIDKQEKAGKEKIDVIKTFKSSFSGPSFIRAILISPIIFYSFYKINGAVIHDVSGYILAFQNGFFWKTIFSSFSKK